MDKMVEDAWATKNPGLASYLGPSESRPPAGGGPGPGQGRERGGGRGRTLTPISSFFVHLFFQKRWPPEGQGRQRDEEAGGGGRRETRFTRTQPARGEHEGLRPGGTGGARGPKGEPRAKRGARWPPGQHGLFRLLHGWKRRKTPPFSPTHTVTTPKRVPWLWPPFRGFFHEKETKNSQGTSK